MHIKEKKIQYHLNGKGEFAIENFTEAKPFANFLPAVAGPHGIPLWAFYVNRGQGIASFGVSDKDHAIMQFFPANRSYEQTALRGFRTFIKVIQKKEILFYEPFQNHLPNQKYDLQQKMTVEASEFSLHEQNMSLGLNVDVEYFGVPNETFAALARKVVIKNNLGVTQELEVLDGLPSIVPFGLKEFYLKDMSRTVEAWMQSMIFEKKESAAFFKLKSDPEDRPEYQGVNGAHFYVSFGQVDNKKAKPIFPSVIVDPDCIFGPIKSFADPRAFLAQTPFDLSPFQITENKTPCAFGLSKVVLEPGESITLYSYIGEAKNRDEFSRGLARISKPQYFSQKQEESQRLINLIQDSATTVSSSRPFDNYCRQTFLDNVLRGGYPYRVPTENGDFLFHVYSRKHGDLERDYNRFVVQPTYFSQGEGNYRDVNQNRRNDVWFDPKCRDLNVRTFFNLIQLDGYNPLIVEQLKLRFDSLTRLKNKLSKKLPQQVIQDLITYLKTPRTPGEIYHQLETLDDRTRVRKDEYFGIILTFAQRWETARHGEGFWSEHWTYNLDTLESFLAIYPEELESLLLKEKDFTFYDNTHRVKPRFEKYVELEPNVIRQYQSVFKDEAKQHLLDSRDEEPDKVRGRYGKGKIFQTTLLAKIICVIANKYASLDPWGHGVEMEADKPDWFDALNGLPGLLGSSLSGTYELLRLVRFVQDALSQVKLSQTAAVALPIELMQLLKKLDLLTRKHSQSKVKSKDLDFWNESHDAKEAYWQNIRFGISGSEQRLPMKALKKILQGFEAKLADGIRSAYDVDKEVCPTYFVNEVVEYKKIPAKSRKSDLGYEGAEFRIVPKKFKQRALAPFLEGPVHALRVERDEERLKAIYNQVRSSDLFDRKLGMYCVTSSLQKETPEIGRVKVFSPGWLENQSVFLHMEYKWLLELLKKGLHNEFFTDFQSALVAFQDPKVYGRSILENSSFIASSAFGDKNVHGSGFVARLSGSTSEFMDMWLRMNVGANPFRVTSKGEIEFHLNPTLPEWIFTKEETRREISLRGCEPFVFTIPKSSYAFVFMSQTLIVFLNPKRTPTFGPRRAIAKRMTFQDTNKQTVMINGNVLPAPHAKNLREGKIRRLEVELG